MKKQMYRITMTENASMLCKNVVSAAALSNGATNPEKRVSLEGLKGIYQHECFEFPSTGKNSTAELIGKNILHIDQKVGETYETVCIIEQVEIVELANLENVVSQQNGYGALAD